MRAMEATRLTVPLYEVFIGEERDRPRPRAVLAQRALSEGARWTRAVALDLDPSRGSVSVKSGGIEGKAWRGQ
jgi:hypothetical protein